MMRYLFGAICLTFFLTAAIAQSKLPMPSNIKKSYNNDTRSLQGIPGKKYWQNTANYTIDVSLNPNNNVISGTAHIEYINNSPDTLRSLLFKCYPNIYKKGAERLMPIHEEDITEGIQIEKLKIAGEEISKNNYHSTSTNMNVRILPLAPGHSVICDVEYHYTLNKNSHIRQGQVDDGAYFVAYFFPRIAVYDDVDGWNQLPYLGNLEFYNDFCNFNLSVTVPPNYQVWATGDLINAENVLNEPYLSRFKNANQSDSVSFIIDSTDQVKKNISKNNFQNTWKFTAGNVTDIAFACSNHYLWQSSSLVADPQTGRRTRADAVFNKDHKDYYLVASDARKTVQAMSYQFPKWPYPYNHITVFDGLDQMEYPMMANDNPIEDRHESIELTTHEIFHTMFPFYMGTNETKYAWMDEGWATIGEWVISPLIDTSIIDLYGVKRTETAAGTEADLPIMINSTYQNGMAYFINSYPKPALAYLYAKEMLGDTKFFAGLHFYFTHWHSKHPLPYDFFAAMNAGSGTNLNWFWQRWFFDNSTPNLAILKLQGKGSSKKLFIKNIGGKPMPVHINILYKDGSTQKIYRSAALWQNSSLITIPVKATKSIKTITLGSPYVIDTDYSDNSISPIN